MGAQPDTLTSTREVWHGVPQILAQVSVAAHLATYLAPRGLTRAVKRYNAEGVDGLRDRKIPGRPCRLTPEQETELKRLVLAGPQERETGRAEFRICDIVALIERTWGIRMSAEAVRTKLHALKLEKLV